VLDAGNRVPPAVHVAEGVRFEALAEMLWQSLAAGAAEVDRIHDEFFAEIQVEFFRQAFDLPTQLALDLNDAYCPFDSPTAMFLALSKPAQLIVVRDGLLQQAIDNFEQVKKDRIEHERARQEEWACRSQRQGERWQLLRGVRAADHEQCVFCGRQLKSGWSYLALIDGVYRQVKSEPLHGEPSALIIDQVVTTCAACREGNKGKPPTPADQPTFGRFQAQGQTAGE